MQDHQAVIASHTDTGHAHVHIVVNVVHSGTGKSVPGLQNDELAQSAERFEARKATLRAATQAERAQERAGWQALDREREEEWTTWRATFGIRSRRHAAQVQAGQAQDAAQGHRPNGDGGD